MRLATSAFPWRVAGWLPVIAVAACVERTDPLPALLIKSVPYAPGKSHSLCGYQASDGTVLVEPIYDSADPFHPAGFAVVHHDALGGLLDCTGRVVVPPLHPAGATTHDGARRLDLNDGRSTHFGELPNVFLDSAAAFGRHFPDRKPPTDVNFSTELIIGIRACPQCRRQDRPEHPRFESHRNAHEYVREWWAIARLPSS